MNFEGDGNDNDGWSTFVDVVTDALDSAWSVEVWSWRQSLSKKFVSLSARSFEVLKIVYLDDFNILIKPPSYQQSNNKNNNSSILDRNRREINISSSNTSSFAVTKSRSQTQTQPAVTTTIQSQSQSKGIKEFFDG